MNVGFVFVKNTLQKLKNIYLMLSNTSLMYLMSHFRLSTLYYKSQLVDIFAYEVVGSGSTVYGNKELGGGAALPLTTTAVYNVHSMSLQDRYFIFVNNLGTSGLNFKSTTVLTLDSIAELYSAANWLEREVSELHGVGFYGKKDLRNLMLQYGDSTAPFKKNSPSIGFKEMFFEPTKDTLVQVPIGLQA